MKSWKRLAATIFAASMVVTSVGCGQTTTNSESTDAQNVSTSVTTSESSISQEKEAEAKLSWLNTSGELPIVEEGTEKTLSMAILMDVNSGEPEDMWFYQFIEEHMNINLEVTKFTPNNKSEFLSLAFADNDLPDIIIGAGLSTADLMTYGAYEGQLMDLAPYITENLMPNLSALYAEHPEYKAAVTDNEGHVWSLGYINDPADRGQIPRMFINYDWLEEAGLGVPETTDELLTVLRAFKRRGEDVIPLGGSANTNPPTVYLLNAFGYNTADKKGTSACIRDGKVVLPIADREAYGAYLEFMNTLYTEGLIHPDYFTMDGTTANAIVSAGNVGFISQAPFVFLSDFSSWWGAKPLTSEYNEESFWPASMNSLNSGNFVVSAECEEPELALAFADWFFTEENYVMSVQGPADVQTEYLDNISGFHIDEETGTEIYLDVTNNSNKYANQNEYLYDKVLLWSFKILGLGASNTKLPLQKLAGIENPIDTYPDVTDPKDDSELRKTITNGETHFRCALQDTLCSEVEIGLSANIYLDAETALEMGNLLTALKEYGSAETAKFITGARPLSELDEYFDEMEKLGALDYVKVYQECYDAMK